MAHEERTAAIGAARRFPYEHPNLERNVMSIVITLIVGGIIGWLASIVMKTDAQMGVIANIIVGIVGSGVGSFLAGMVGISAGGIGSWIISLLGAIALIALLRIVGLFK